MCKFFKIAHTKKQVLKDRFIVPFVLKIVCSERLFERWSFGSVSKNTPSSGRVYSLVFTMLGRQIRKKMPLSQKIILHPTKPLSKTPKHLYINNYLRVLEKAFPSINPPLMAPITHIIYFYSYSKFSDGGLVESCINFGCWT